MQLAMIGLGRMGANMVRRLIKGGHQCVVFDLNPKSIAQVAGDGAEASASLDDLVGKRIHHGDFDFYLGDELNGIFGTPINFGVPTLTAKAANVGDGDALHAHIADCLANIIELERLNNGGN